MSCLVTDGQHARKAESRWRKRLLGAQRFADNQGMSRISLVLVVVVAALVAVPVAGGAQCDRSGVGDICASGSVWYDFTRLRIQPREGSAPTTTMTLHPQQDFSIDIKGGKGQRGKIIVIGGRAMLMREVAHEKGYEIDALDGPVLMNQLIVTLLDQAFPAGPSSVRSRHRVRIEQKMRAIRIATSSASGRFEAPWTLTGTVRRRDGRIEYDLRFSARTPDGPYSFDASGFWVKESNISPVDERMPLDGWTVHWLGPMTMTSAQGTTLDYAARPASELWEDVAALRKWISEEPDRRASRRVPVDPSNPGRPESISFEAFEIDKTGTRKALGSAVREYKPGTDVLAEDTGHNAISKTLSLGHGLSVSTDVYRESTLTGFGLVLVKDRTPCFSWEWFDNDSGDVFSKLQGGGKVKVRIVDSGGTQELAAVEFLDDVVLDCQDRSNGTVYEARVKKGSVLRLRPQ
jgi:hypothetical protein